MARRRSTSNRTNKRGTSSSSRKSPRKSSSRKSGPPPLPEFYLTFDQYMDILGYGLTFAALLAILSFLSANQGALPAAVAGFLRQVFGWAAYLMPFIVGAVGLCIVLRRFADKIPHVTPLQIVGGLVGFLALLVTFHVPATSLLGNGDPWLTAERGFGGGYLGAAMSNLLTLALGNAGAIAALVVWWLIAITFAFGVTIKEAVEALQQWRKKRGLQPSKPLPKPAKERVTGRPLPAQKPTEASAQVAGPRPAISAATPSPPPAAPVRTHLLGSTHTWQLPLLDEILEPGNGQDFSEEILRQQARAIEDTLENLGAPVWVKEINRGPVVTQFAVEPRKVTNARCPNCKKRFDYPGAIPDDDTSIICPNCDVRTTGAEIEAESRRETKVKVSRIEALAGDLALALEAKTLRIEAPIPGKGLVGIEIPNQEVTLVALREVMESDQFAELDSPLKLCLGQDVSGSAAVADLTAMPHLLIAGTTGSGKSVCVNAIIAALLLQNTPGQLEFLMVDPKRVELIGYNGIPHLRQAKVVVEMERVTAVLQWVLREMDGRYRRFSKVRAIHIRDYNERVAVEREEPPLPYIVVVIDELADLMMLAPQETEKSLCRIAQMARATGIHLIVATQRPSVNVVTGLIKANFPARIAFNVASTVDSRVILDMPGAEQLLGRGDMLFMPPDAPTPIRLQGAFVSDEELRRLVQYWKDQARPEVVPGAKPVQQPLWEEMQREALKAKFEDDLIPEVIDLVLRENRASISLLQRKLRIGYTRAARIMDILERQKIVGPQPSGGQAREVFPSIARKLLQPPE
ncbi:MAG: DNA translocase FtsK 4TM domain-containing protein [Anaerolineae bacterium]|nr:DNA translocase FtsK 4TM domain-containing protein [Anaerolineae bacterium]